MNRYSVMFSGAFLSFAAIACTAEAPKSRDGVTGPVAAKQTMTSGDEVGVTGSPGIPLASKRPFAGLPQDVRAQALAELAALTAQYREFFMPIAMDKLPKDQTELVKTLNARGAAEMDYFHKNVALQEKYGVLDPAVGHAVSQITFTPTALPTTPMDTAEPYDCEWGYIRPCGGTNNLCTLSFVNGPSVTGCPWPDGSPHYYGFLYRYMADYTVIPQAHSNVYPYDTFCTYAPNHLSMEWDYAEFAQMDCAAPSGGITVATCKSSWLQTLDDYYWGYCELGSTGNTYRVVEDYGYKHKWDTVEKRADCTHDFETKGHVCHYPQLGPFQCPNPPPPMNPDKEPQLCGG